jgi:hypothetical protein
MSEQTPEPESKPSVESTPSKQCSFEPTCGVHFWDNLLDKLRGILSVKLFENIVSKFALMGHWSLLTAIALGLLTSVILSIRVGSVGILVVGIGLAVALSVLQYTADKFLHSGAALIKSTPTQLSTRSFVDCLGLLFLVASILALVMGVVEGVETSSAAPVLEGLVQFAVLGFILWIALNPTLAGTKIKKNTTAGEEAIGVLSFLMKGALRLVPILFGVATLVGAITLLGALIRSLGSADHLGNAIHLSGQGAKLAIAGAAAPFLIFIAFLFYYLTINVISAILSLPGKVDKLSDK